MQEKFFENKKALIVLLAGCMVVLVSMGIRHTWGLFYFFIPFSVSLYLTVFLLILGHSGGGSQWAFSTYGLQVLTPDRLRGRIAGIDYSLYFLMNTISTLMIGYLATVYGVLFVFKLFPVIGFLFGFVWYLSTKNIWKNLDKS